MASPFLHSPCSKFSVFRHLIVDKSDVVLLWNISYLYNPTPILHLASGLWRLMFSDLGISFASGLPAMSACCESLSYSSLVLMLHLGSCISYCILDGRVDLAYSSLAISSVFQGIWISCASPAHCLDCWGGLHFLEPSPHLPIWERASYKLADCSLLNSILRLMVFSFCPFLPS